MSHVDDVPENPDELVELVEVVVDGDPSPEEFVADEAAVARGEGDGATV